MGILYTKEISLCKLIVGTGERPDEVETAIAVIPAIRLGSHSKLKMLANSNLSVSVYDTIPIHFFKFLFWKTVVQILDMKTGSRSTLLPIGIYLTVVESNIVRIASGA